MALGGAEDGSVVEDGGAATDVEMVDVTSVVVSMVVGVVSVTTLEVGVVAMTGGIVGEAVGQEVTVTVTVT